MTVGWGIIGIGRHSDRRMAPAIAQAAGANLIAVYSRDAERAGQFASRHGVARAYNDLDAMLRDTAIDAVYVASPNALHATHTIQAAMAGKHVLCEKPMALTVADADAMVETCRRRGVKLGVGFHLRHHPAHIEMRRQVVGDAIGQVVVARAEFSMGFPSEVRAPGVTIASPLRAWWAEPTMVGGGSMMGMGVHAIDLLRFLVGEEVTEVAAFTDADEETLLESIATVILRFADGSFGHVCTSRSIPEPENDVVVYGSMGTLQTRGSVSMDPAGEVTLRARRSLVRWQFQHQDPYGGEVEAFCRAVEFDTDFAASGVDGLRVVEITEAVFASAREGRAIRVGA